MTRSTSGRADGQGTGSGHPVGRDQIGPLLRAVSARRASRQGPVPARGRLGRDPRRRRYGHSAPSQEWRARCPSRSRPGGRRSARRQRRHSGCRWRRPAPLRGGPGRGTSTCAQPRARGPTACGRATRASQRSGSRRRGRIPEGRCAYSAAHRRRAWRCAAWSLPSRTDRASAIRFGKCAPRSVR